MPWNIGWKMVPKNLVTECISGNSWSEVRERGRCRGDRGADTSRGAEEPARNRAAHRELPPLQGRTANTTDRSDMAPCAPRWLADRCESPRSRRGQYPS